MPYTYCVSFRISGKGFRSITIESLVSPKNINEYDIAIALQALYAVKATSFENISFTHKSVALA